MAWRPDGLIGLVSASAVHEALLAAGLPVVNVSTREAHSPFPTVGPDNAAAGAMAGRFLLARGFRHLAFCGGPTTLHYAAMRQEGIREIAEAAGATFETFADDVALNRRDATAIRWLRALPKPVGILGVADEPAAWQCDLCHIAGLRVPEEVALVGIEDDDLVCDFTAPTLSSVRLPGQRIGYEAARLLDALMDGQPPPDAPLLLPPVDVVARGSTQTTPIADPDVRATVEYIARQTTFPIRVDALLAEVQVSYRALRERFKRVRGRTIQAEILEHQFTRAKALLVESDLPIPEVAAAIGLASSTQFTATFRKYHGLTPMQYRRQYRAEPGPQLPPDTIANFLQSQ